MAIYRGAGGSGDATTDAANQASVASDKAAQAASSATAAAGSATSSATSASDSSTSAIASASSATSSANSATASASSATAAASSATAAAASFDSFDDRYLGAKSSAPTTDNDGNALAEGAMYYDTGDDIIYVWNGTTWQTITTGSGGLQAANNLSDVNSASASRTNLGLAIGSDVQAFSSVLAGTTASYTTAEETKLAGIETGATADQTAAQIKTAYESNADTNAFTDADHTKLDGIEVSADVTGTTNVTAAGALMDSELTSEASVKALNQGVATTDSPSFAGLTTTADINFGDNDKAVFGAGSDLQIYHNGANSLIEDVGTGDLYIRSSNEIRLQDGTNTNYFYAIQGGKASLYYNGGEKLATTATGVDVTGTVNATSFTGSGSSLSGLVSQTSATGSAVMPSGTTAQRNGSPNAGNLRFNTTDTSFEGYDGSAWGAIGGGGGASGGGSDAIFYENGQTITTSYSITASTNAMSTGPLTVNSGVSVTVPSGSRWVVL